MFPILPVIAAVSSWLTAPSVVANKMLPKAIKDGAASAILSIATKRYILLSVLIGLSVFGSDAKENERALADYVMHELGVTTEASVLDSN